MIGNALEVVEVLEVLRGDGPEDLKELCLHTAGWMLHLGGVSKTVAEGKQQSAQLISSGKALEKFRQMVRIAGWRYAESLTIPSGSRRREAACKWCSAKKRFHFQHAVRTDWHRVRDSRRWTRTQGRLRRSGGRDRSAQEGRRSVGRRRAAGHHPLQQRQRVSSGRAR